MILMPLPSTRCAAPILLSASLFLAGCGALSSETEVSETRITAAFYPLYYAAERVAGDHFEVINLTRSGIEPHDLDLSVRQTRYVADGQLVIFESDFQPAVDKAVAQNAAGDVLDAAKVISLRAYGEEEHEHDEEGGDEHDHGDHDPHFWLDPLLMADFSDAIADRLSDIDPGHKDAYAANAAQFRSELEDLDQAYVDGLATCAQTTVVVNHDAFGYLSRYGLSFEAITGLSPGAEPSASDRSRLQKLIQSEGLNTVFSETLDSKKAAISLASDLGIKAEVLDPIEGLGDTTSDEDYLSLMNSNLDALKKANGC